MADDLTKRTARTRLDRRADALKRAESGLARLPVHQPPDDCQSCRLRAWIDTQRASLAQEIADAARN